MQAGELLTALLPTRNRPHNISGQLNLFTKSSLRVVVADSSDPQKAAEIKAASSGLAQLLSYAPDMKFFDKLADAIEQIETPFVLLASDRKITFPHAVTAALAFIREHEDYVSAQGWVIGFNKYDDDIDINRIVFFTPTIDSEEPLWRHYHLMRRYQSRQFSVFRVGPLKTAIAQARTIEGPVFQEVMFMNALVLQGKVARLPNIFTLQTPEQSFNRLRDIDPFYWFLHDLHSFHRHYISYQDSLARFISERNLTRLARRDLLQVIGAVHAVWLHYNFDFSVLNRATQQLLNGEDLNLPNPYSPIPWRDIGPGDVVHAEHGARRYIWRSNVLNAEPMEEILITPGEMVRVERQLEAYYGS